MTQLARLGRHIPMWSVVFIVTSVSVALSSVPPLLNYQGVLRDGTGELVPDGNYSVTFRIWDSETSGNALWQEGRLIAVERGLFTVLLGSIVSIPDTLFSNPNRWISLQVGLDSEMLPRQRLVSVPFAWASLTAAMADSAGYSLASRFADTAEHSLDRTIDATDLTSGVLDTTRYSAYYDLVSEGRVGNSGNQVAQGDHSHPPTVGFGGLVSLENASDSAVTIGTPGLYALKSVVVPAGEIGRYFQIFMTYNKQQNVPGGASTFIRIYVDGELLWSTGNLGGVNSSDAVSFELGRMNGGYWLANVLDPDPTRRTLNSCQPEDGLVVEVMVFRDGDNFESHTYEVPELIVIYDKD